MGLFPVQAEYAKMAFANRAKIVKAKLRELHITAAKEVDVGSGQGGGSGRRAIVIFVPVPQLKAFQKIQPRLVRELEKKFSGKHVVFIAQRRILPKPTRKANKLK